MVLFSPFIEKNNQRDSNISMGFSCCLKIRARRNVRNEHEFTVSLCQKEMKLLLINDSH